MERIDGDAFSAFGMAAKMETDVVKYIYSMLN